MRTIHTVIRAIVLLVISFALVIGLALGVGWIISLILPLSLFEATLVSMIAAIITWGLWRSMISSAEDIGPGDEGELEAEDLPMIPLSRFHRTDAERTWQNWFRYMIANTTYHGFLGSSWMAQMNEEQLEELSIRLADAALAGLKSKSPRTRRLRVNKGTLKHELNKMGQKPYDDDILDTAVGAINEELDFLQEELREVMRGKLWDELADIF